MLGQVKRFDPVPLVQAGGHQPFHGSMARPPGDALWAMLAGRTFGGINPMDVQRNMQMAMKARPRTGSTLLDALIR